MTLQTGISQLLHVAECVLSAQLTHSSNNMDCTHVRALVPSALMVDFQGAWASYRVNVGFGVTSLDFSFSVSFSGPLRA